MKMKKRLALVALLVREYDEAIEFFVGRLGFRLMQDARIDAVKRWVVVAPDDGTGSALLLARAANEEQSAQIGRSAGGRVAFFLHTDDFDRDHARFTNAGVRFQTEPREEAYGRVAVFEDLYGNRWDLIGPGVNGG